MGGDYHLIKGNPEALKKECVRIASYQNNKYKTDEEYRNKKKAYAKEYRLLKKKRIAEQLQTETGEKILGGGKQND